MSSVSQTATPAPRVWAKIQHTSRYGRLDAGEHVGLSRESLTDSDREVRDWFISEAEALGCLVKIDEMGNIFAILPGENNSIAPIGIGSHLDSQPAGGRFDGILGVISALEVLRTIKALGIRTYAPLAAINWTNEEGSRFPKMCAGSGVWSGTESLAECHDLASIEALSDGESPLTMRTELQRINYLGNTPCSHVENPLSAHFELHIEQGSLLEKAMKRIGVVRGVQGMRWYAIHCLGREAHAGATPMSERADALVVLAKLTVKVEELSIREGAFGTVGVMRTKTNSTNTVPGGAFCTLDLRHQSEEVLDRIETGLRQYLFQLAEDRAGISVTMERTWSKRSVGFDKVTRACVQAAAIENAGHSMTMDMVSYAGHDSAETATVVPTAMIFVPSRGGVSHNPAEYTSAEECDLGAKVLLDAVQRYDQHLRRKATAAL
ncbi:beta-alanine synthase [Aspergillus heterothallicus]